jgi:predicted transcriptional regulator
MSARPGGIINSKVMTQVRFEPELWDRLEHKAVKEGQSKNWHVNEALRKYLAEEKAQ